MYVLMYIPLYVPMYVCMHVCMYVWHAAPQVTCTHEFTLPPRHCRRQSHASQCRRLPKTFLLCSARWKVVRTTSVFRPTWQCLARVMRRVRTVNLVQVDMTCQGCSSPPCLDCFAGNQLYAKQRPGCAANDTSVGCVPPETAMGYKGKHWPTTEISGINEMHIFLIGDWGGLDGTLDTAENRPEMIAYDWAASRGPASFPRSRWNKPHTERLCGHKQFVECFNTRGAPPCIPDCGYVEG